MDRSGCARQLLAKKMVRHGRTYRLGGCRLTYGVIIWPPVIRSFRCEETREIFELRRSRRLPLNIQQVALRKLRMLNRAISLEDLRLPPANRLEKLSGDRGGQWSIRINDQWRVCFRWKEGDALDVEIVDYH